MEVISPLFAPFVEYGYLLIFVAIFLENAGLPFPGEPILFAFGFLARTGHLDLGAGIAFATAAAMAGDSASYWLGRFAGPRLLRTYCRVTLGSGQCVERAVAYHRRFGKMAVVFGRFVMGVRAFLSPLAGSVRMPYGQFLVFDGVGSLLWSSLFVGVGYAFAGQVEGIAARYHQGVVIVGGVMLAGFVGYLALKLAKRRRTAPGLLPDAIPGGGDDGHEDRDPRSREAGEIGI